MLGVRHTNSVYLSTTPVPVLSLHSPRTQAHSIPAEAIYNPWRLWWPWEQKVNLRNVCVSYICCPFNEAMRHDTGNAWRSALNHIHPFWYRHISLFLITFSSILYPPFGPFASSSSFYVPHLTRIYIRYLYSHDCGCRKYIVLSHYFCNYVLICHHKFVPAIDRNWSILLTNLLRFTC